MEASNTDQREQELARREADIAAREKALRDNPDANVQESTIGAQPPRVDSNPANLQDAQALSEALAEFRKEVNALRQERQELERRRTNSLTTPAPTETPEDRANAHLELVAQHDFYCPACGRLGKYAQQCTGPIGGFPHAPQEMVPTEELGGDPADHTQAPSTDPDQPHNLAA